MKSKRYLIGVLSLLLLWSCASEKQSDQGQVAVSLRKAPEFSADSAYQFIQKQVDFGPRVPNTPEHRVTRNWLVEQFKAYGWEVQTQDFQAKTYDGITWNLSNIIASYNPNAKKRILLGAHWDTRRIADKDTERINEPIDGANDGGSGVAVLLEIARVIGTGADKPDVGIDIILFDGEDDGEPEHMNLRDNSKIWWCHGSQYWSKNLHEPGYTAYFGILVDLVGAKGARFYREGYSMYFAKNIVQKVWNYATELGYSDFFIHKDSPEIMDDHLFVNKDAKIPMINIIEYSPQTGFGLYHHTHLDNMDIIDRRTLKAVGQTVLVSIFQE